MWRVLGSRTRRVLVALWFGLAVAFLPSQTWAAGQDDASSTSAPAPTSPQPSESSSPPQPSPTEQPEMSSFTAEPEASEPSPTGPDVVQLEPGQWEELTALLEQQPSEPASSTSTGTVTLDPSQWDRVQDYLVAVVVGVVVLVLTVGAGVIASWGRRG